MEQAKIRQPIVTVVGHVDHGKTSILDCLRGTSVQAGEAGGITQEISFTLYPIEQLKKTFPIVEKSSLDLKIPGFLFIDTPGHAAFTNLRKRGGNLADIAILVIDINEGIKPQTQEVIQILRHGKTPFIIALNKIDNVSGWRTGKNLGLRESIQSQGPNTARDFDGKYLTIMGSLSSLGFESDLFYNINDFTKKIALVPCSARTREGIPELMMVLCGLSQKYLGKRLELGRDAKGVILEVKKEKSISYAESILYDGELSKNSEIAVSNLEGKPVVARIRVLEEVEPLKFRFKPKDSVKASTGMRMQFSEKIDALPGMLFMAFKNNKDEVGKIFAQEIKGSVKTQGNGIVAKADSLGSLEALLFMLKQSSIPVLKAGIGSISKADVISAKANLEINPVDALILGFNVSVDDEVEAMKGNVKILGEDVIYKLIDNALAFREERRRQIEKERMMGLSTLCKLRILKQFVFRNSNPAVFGVRVEAGKLVQGLHIMDEKSERIGRIKNIQLESKSIPEASEGMEIAVSVPGINFERVLGDRNFLYSDMTESQFKSFKKNKDLLSGKEISLLQEISEIKKREKPDWGN
jgi:translation initiation factor 5B